MYTALWLEDDCAEIPPFVERVCNMLNATILFVKTFSAANDIMQKQQIDVFLLDIEIAGERLTGIEFARQIRSSQRYYKTPIIFVSNYSHLSRHLFATVRYCQLLSKPYNEEGLERSIGSALGIYRYSLEQCADTSLMIPVKRERIIEVDARTVCYIEFLKENAVRIQYNYGECITLNCQRSARKFILDQIHQNKISHLVQIYRSIVVNIHEIKSVKQEGREGSVYLFGEDIPKPLGSKYRDNLKNFL